MQVAVGMGIWLKRGVAPDLQENLLVASERQRGGRLAPRVDLGRKPDRVAVHEDAAYVQPLLKTCARG